MGFEIFGNFDLIVSREEFVNGFVGVGRNRGAVFVCWDGALAGFG